MEEQLLDTFVRLQSAIETAAPHVYEAAREKAIAAAWMKTIAGGILLIASMLCMTIGIVIEKKMGGDVDGAGLFIGSVPAFGCFVFCLVFGLTGIHGLLTIDWQTIQLLRSLV